MLKQKRQLFEFLFITSDLVVVSIAWVLAYWLRFYTDIIAPDKGIPPLSYYLPMLLFIWLIWAFVFRRFGLYRAMRGVRRNRELWLLLEANIFSTILLIAVTYLFREKSVPFSRLVFLYFGVIATALTIGERAALRSFLRGVRRRGYNLRYMLVVGAGQVAADLAARVRAHRELGYQLIGCLSRDGVEKKGPKGIPIVGKYEDLQTILKNMDIDQVVVAMPFDENHLLPEIMAQVGDSLIDVKIVPDIFPFVRVGGKIEEFEGLPIISVQESPVDGMNLVVKRIVDIAISAIALVVLSPLFLIIALLIKILSRGPVFYRQERVSYDGTRFSIYKFRTMSVDAEASGPGWTVKGDDRVTPFGKILRGLSLDELPQLVNVLRGEMSLVGPRPERPVYIDEFKKHVPRYMLRHKVPAGMTGWAQIHGWRGDTSIDKRIEYDMYYLEHWSLLLDLKIIFLTLIRGFRNRNAC